MSAGSAADATTTAQVEVAFRTLYRRCVTRLAREFGFHLTELAEDAVQSAMLVALRSWARDGQPTRPAAWLYRVARNRMLDSCRRDDRHRSLTDAESTGAEFDAALVALDAELPTASFASEIASDELRMLFVCADEAIPAPSRVVLALKILCGLSTREIALRLLITEENVQKRLARGRERLRELGPEFAAPSLAELQERRTAVLQVIYLLFNEGYSSTLPDEPIRRELCDEALRLGHMLAEHPVCGSPEGDALLALMYLHAARFDARFDEDGGLLLLEQQNRARWDIAAIRCGLEWLHRAARADHLGRYQAEAAIAATHCVAASFAATDWQEIVRLYLLLERIEPSPLYRLNRAIALAEWQGAEAGLAVLEEIEPPGWLARYYLWDATVGELQRRVGRFDTAARHLRRALAAAPHPVEQALIARRLRACENGDSARC